VPAILALCLVVARPGGAAPGETAREVVDPKAGYVFVALPGGTFSMGCLPKDTMCDPDEARAAPVVVPAFLMGRHEATVAQYAACAAASACPATPRTFDSGEKTGNWKHGRLDHPINGVTLDEAAAFCAFVGGSLPTAAEWEYAARGGSEDRLYPWGDAPPDATRANVCDATCAASWRDEQSDAHPATAPVGSFPAGVGRFGLHDLAGNVWEWTSTTYREDTFEVRGGGWNAVSLFVRSSYRGRLQRATRATFNGVRCVRRGA